MRISYQDSTTKPQSPGFNLQLKLCNVSSVEFALISISHDLLALDQLACKLLLQNLFNAWDLVNLAHELVV
jgi:hypothetical protein